MTPPLTGPTTQAGKTLLDLWDGFSGMERRILAIEAEERERVLAVMDAEIDITDRRHGHVTDLKYNVRATLREAAQLSQAGGKEPSK